MDEASRENLRAALQSDQEADDDGDCEVWPQHWETVCAFVAAGTQWRMTTIGGGFVASRIVFIGLDYSAVRVVLDAEGFNVTPELWRGIRIMEAEAVRVLNGID